MYCDVYMLAGMCACLCAWLRLLGVDGGCGVDGSGDDKTRCTCKPLVSISLQPLGRLHRLLLAHYAQETSKIMRPKMLVSLPHDGGCGMVQTSSISG